jgi:hypothetical protein
MCVSSRSGEMFVMVIVVVVSFEVLSMF